MGLKLTIVWDSAEPAAIKKQITELGKLEGFKPEDSKPNEYITTVLGDQDSARNKLGAFCRLVISQVPTAKYTITAADANI